MGTVVRERDESTRAIKLPLELYGTDKPPVADPTPPAMSRSGRLLIPNVRHTDVVP